MSNSNATSPTFPQPLANSWRWLMAAAAVTGFGAGGTAVFKTDNEVGSTALLAVGLYFVIVAALGRFPKVKLGDNEIDPGVIAAAAVGGADLAAGAAAKAALEKKPAEEVAQAARRVEEGMRNAFVIPLTGGGQAFQEWIEANRSARDKAGWADEKEADDTDQGR